MCKSCLVAFVSAVVIVAGWNRTDTASAQTTAVVTEDHGAVFKQYCLGCHNDRLKTGGMSLEHVDVNDVAADPDLWENVLRKLQRGAMPPATARHPDQAIYA